MAKKLDVGVLVLCVRCEDPDYAAILVGQAGTIIARVPSIYDVLTGKDWMVEFPNMADVPCPNCGRCHGTKIPMLSHEIIPIEDPDQFKDEPIDKDIVEPLELEYVDGVRKW